MRLVNPASPSSRSPRRRTGPAGCIAQAVVGSPLGDLRLACTERGLAGLWFVGQADDPGATVAPLIRHRWLDQAADELQGYWAHRHGQRAGGGQHGDPPEGPRFAVPLDLHGTPLQRAVWQALLDVPPGAVDSYANLAARAGHPGAVRAVGAAVGRNPVSVIVPCHRIVASDGRLTGFGGGLPRKLALLRLEGALPGPQPGGDPRSSRPAVSGAVSPGTRPVTASPAGTASAGQPASAAEAPGPSISLLARLRVPPSAWWPGSHNGRDAPAHADAQPHAHAATARLAGRPAQAELPWSAEGQAR